MSLHTRVTMSFAFPFFLQVCVEESLITKSNCPCVLHNGFGFPDFVAVLTCLYSLLFAQFCIVLAYSQSFRLIFNATFYPVVQ